MQANAALITPTALLQNYPIAVSLLAGIISCAMTAPGLFKTVIKEFKYAL